MTSFGFNNRWELNAFSKCGDLVYESGEFSNLVTNTGKRWFLYSTYSRYDCEFDVSQKIELLHLYNEPTEWVGFDMNVVDNVGNYGATMYTRQDLEGYFFEFTGDNDFAPDPPTTTPVITDTITLTINEGFSTYIYNVLLTGEASIIGQRYNFKTVFSIAALPIPYFWSNEEVLEITYTLECVNSSI